MDASCLFDLATLRVLSVSPAWVSRFGFSEEEARRMLVTALTPSPGEVFGSALALGTPAAASGRGRFRGAGGVEMLADFEIVIHSLPSGPVGGLLVAGGTLGEPHSLEDSAGEAISELTVPPNLRAALRERLARCARQQAALLALSAIDDQDFAALTRKCLKTDAETLDVARVSYWRLGRGGESIVCEALLDRSKAAFEAGMELSARDYPGYFRALTTGALIPAHDALRDPRTTEFADGYLAPLGIGAMLDIPVFLRGDLVGILCHEHVGGARGWTMDEQQFALSVGQMLSLALSAHHGDEAARSLRQREVMLAEANATLDRALRAGDGPLTGTTLGRYRLAERIGRGGMGEVYKALRIEDGAVVALKLLKKVLVADPDNARRFFREARLTASVPSEHVAKVFEVGTFEDGVPFIAMELLEGHDLAWHLRRSPQLPTDQVVELCEHTARALGAVRRAGVVHRDLKPGNLFLVDAIPRAWKVLDFGISRSADDPFQTMTEEVAGSPSYMAPEQLGGEEVDHRADLYALAAIAFRALTGRPPFVGDLASVLSATLRDPAPRVSSLVPGLPEAVDLVFAVALAKAPSERFAEVEQFSAALRDACAGRLDETTRAAGLRLVESPS